MCVFRHSLAESFVLLRIDVLSLVCRLTAFSPSLLEFLLTKIFDESRLICVKVI